MDCTNSWQRGEASPDSRENNPKRYPHVPRNKSADDPWEDIYDAAPIEGGSLKLPYNDKGTKGEKKAPAKLENRPKLPVGTYLVNLQANNLETSTCELLKKPEDKEPIKWCYDGSMRLFGVA